MQTNCLNKQLSNIGIHVLLCFSSLSSEAYQVLKNADKNGVEVGLAAYDHVIRTLLSEGSIGDAMAVKKL